MLLIPELCYMTGLSDEQRANYKLMADVGRFTRQPPDKRVETLMDFSRRIADTPKVKQIMEQWGLKFSRGLTEVPGRTLQPEQVRNKRRHTCVSHMILHNLQFPA